MKLIHIHHLPNIFQRENSHWNIFGKLIWSQFEAIYSNLCVVLVKIPVSCSNLITEMQDPFDFCTDPGFTLTTEKLCNWVNKEINEV